MKIIPAIDIVHGKCVRLTQGDFNQMKVYEDDPLDVALSFQQADLEYLHLVDLDGAREGRVVNWKTITELQAKTALLIDFGGGVKSDDDVEHLLELDISQINIGSLAIKSPKQFIRWLKQYGPENFILSADVKGETIMVQGWVEPSMLNLFDVVEDFTQQGLKYLTCTDINSDGMLTGPNFSLYEQLRSKFPQLKITASGGISTLNDLKRLQQLSLHAVIIGKAIYEKKISLEELKLFQQN